MISIYFPPEGSFSSILKDSVPYMGFGGGCEAAMTGVNLS
jgi:hypothetical protein